MVMTFSWSAALGAAATWAALAFSLAGDGAVARAEDHVPPTPEVDRGAAGVGAAQRKGAPGRKLDPAARAKLVAALVGLLLVGSGSMALIWLVARVTRRYVRGYDLRSTDRGGPRSTLPNEHDWATPRRT